METLFDTLSLLALAYIGGRIGIALKLPAGALLGAMLFVGIFRITDVFLVEEVSPLLKIGTQIALGTMIGLQFSKNVLKLPPKRIAAFLLLGIGSIITSLVIVLVFHQLDILSLMTGLIAVAPGGLAEMLTLSDTMNADTQIVVVMHLIRVILILLLFKTLLKWTLRKRGGRIN